MARVFHRSGAPVEPVPGSAGESVPVDATSEAAADEQDANASESIDEPGHAPHPGFLPAQPPRLGAESVLVRIIATAGVIGIGTLLGALLVANNVAGWITGLVVSAVSVILAAVLWRSRTL